MQGFGDFDYDDSYDQDDYGNFEGQQSNDLEDVQEEREDRSADAQPLPRLKFAYRLLGATTGL